MLCMKKILSIFSVIVTLGLVYINGASAYVNRQNAVINILDKASGKNHAFTVMVGQPSGYEKLSFTVRTCKQTDPFQPENAYMFIEIAQSGKQIFSGWMNKNEPGENPLQNVDYDLWLVRCE